MSNFNPATSTRGYYDLVGLYYSGQSLTGFLFAKYRDAPIDFYQSCWNETDPFTGCKLTDELPTRGIVQHPLTKRAVGAGRWRIHFYPGQWG